MIIVSFINRIAKYIVILILTTSFIFSLWWLWQRQPQPTSKTQNQTANLNNQPSKESGITPNDLTVLTSQKVKFAGKTKANSLVALYANSFATVTRSDKDGNFASAEMTFAKGFNQVKMAVISDKLTLEGTTTFNYLFAENTQDGDIVYAGSVKKILDTLITVSSNSDEKDVRTLNSTFTFSQDNPEEAALSPIRRIRIGDFIIAQGFLPQDKNDNHLKANKIEVLRENVPLNTRELVLAKTLATVKQSRLQVQNLSTGSTLELSVGKESGFFLDGEKIDTKAVEKDKNAISIFHKEDKDIIDLIWLLP